MPNLAENFLYLLSTFVAAPLLVILLGRRLLMGSEPWSHLAPALLGSGPLLAGSLLEILLRVFPGFSLSFYRAGLPILIVLGIVVLRSEFKSFSIWAKRQIQLLVRGRRRPSFVAILVGVFAFAYLALSIMVAHSENDFLQYGTMARIFFRDRSLDLYPFSQADPQSGFYAVSSHPLIFHMLVLWNYLAQGHTKVLFAIRFLNPFLIVATWLAIRALYRKDHRVGNFAGFFFLTSPLLLYFIQWTSIDLLRIYALVSVIIPLKRFIKRPSPGSTLLLMLICGLAINTHSLSLLILPILAACLFFFTSGFRKRLIWSSTIPLGIFLFAGFRFMENFRIFGSPISDSPLVWRHPKINLPSYQSMASGIGTVSEVIQKGLLQYWSMPHWYGIVPWIALPGLFLWKRFPEARIIQFMFWFFMSIVAVSVALGENGAVLGPRYLSVMLPLLSIMAALPLARLCKGGINLRSLLVLIGLAYFLFYFPLNRGGSFLKRLDEAARKTRYYKRDSNSDLAWLPRGIHIKNTLKFFETHVPLDSLVLVNRLAEIPFYIDRPIIRDTDPRLLPFYNAQSTEEAWSVLKSLDVKYVYIHHDATSLVTYFNSHLDEILSNSRYAEPVFQSPDVLSVHQILEGSGPSPQEIAYKVFRGDLSMDSSELILMHGVNKDFLDFVPADSRHEITGEHCLKIGSRSRQFSLSVKIAGMGHFQLSPSIMGRDQSSREFYPYYFWNLNAPMTRHLTLKVPAGAKFCGFLLQFHSYGKARVQEAIMFQSILEN